MTPDFPPLLSGHALTIGQNPLRKAAAGAKKGKYSAGDLLWVQDKDHLDYAMVLEPEVNRANALTMIFVQMVALGDAIGAIAPPEVGVTHNWPNVILVNGAKVGEINTVVSDDDDDNHHPQFMVIGTQIAVRPKDKFGDPGADTKKTTLWDEGCGELDALQVLHSSARHFVNWIHTWEEEGFQSVLKQLDGRMEQGHPLTFKGKEGAFLGLDEKANLLFKTDGKTQLIELADILKTSIKDH